MDSCSVMPAAGDLQGRHILLGLTIFLVFPFTRLVHVWSAPIWYLGRTGYQVVRTRRDLRAGVAGRSVPRSAGE